MVLWQDAEADVRGQCAAGEGENLSSLNPVRARGLSEEVLTYTGDPSGHCALLIANISSLETLCRFPLDS